MPVELPSWTTALKLPAETIVANLEYYRIDLKRIREKYRNSELLQVTRRSPFKLRKEVERFAIYFMREFDCPVQEFHVKEKGPYTAYLLTNTYSRDAPVWAGACCFRPESFAYPVHSQTLRWIWLHPYFRAKGILSEIWPELRENHGDFFVEPPLSPAMLHFVLSRNRGSRFYPLYQKLVA
jgi:hypothetical protein